MTLKQLLAPATYGSNQMFSGDKCLKTLYFKTLEMFEGFEGTLI